MLMSSLRRSRPLATGFLVGAFLLLLPLTLAAQTNQSPQITSTPVLSTSVDDGYSYTLRSTDPDGDTTSYTLTVAPEGMKLQTDTLTWDPTTPGVYNVVVEVTDGNNGFDTQTWQITVTHGTVATIVIKPNDRPTEVTTGNYKQFVATLYDHYGNMITSPAIAWTTDSTVGSISSDGRFYAEHGGIGYVAASSGSVEQSVGVVVKDFINNSASAVDQTTDETAAVEETPDTETVEENEQATATDEAEVMTETVMTSEDETAMSESDEMMSTTDELTSQDEATTEEEPCTNIAHNLIILILIIYAVAMVLYYRYERTAPSPAWWIFPLLLTIIGLIIYYQNICVGTYLWWPWSVVGIGVIVTVYYKGKKKSEMPPDEDAQTHLPI